MEQTTYLTTSDFNHFLEERCKERAGELLKEMQAFEFIKRDRGLFNWERARYQSLGAMLKINEDILKLFNPEFTSIQ